MAAPLRGRRGSTWRQFLAQQRDAVLACDCFTVETLFFKTVYGPSDRHLGDAAGAQPHLDAAGRERPAPVPHPRSRREVPAELRRRLRGGGIEIVRTSYRAPNANAYAERWVRSARAECLDHVLVASEAHLRRVLTEYVAFYNHARPHQGLDQGCPVALPVPAREGPVRRCDRLGGLLHDYYRGVA